jgi:hypothetical protein
MPRSHWRGKPTVRVSSPRLRIYCGGATNFPCVASEYHGRGIELVPERPYAVGEAMEAAWSNAPCLDLL